MMLIFPSMRETVLTTISLGAGVVDNYIFRATFRTLFGWSSILISFQLTFLSGYAATCDAG
jgi:hypothetical protein